MRGTSISNSARLWNPGTSWRGTWPGRPRPLRRYFRRTCTDQGARPDRRPARRRRRRLGRCRCTRPGVNGEFVCGRALSRVAAAHRPAPDTGASTRRWLLIYLTLGTIAASAAAPITSCIRADATTPPSGQCLRSREPPPGPLFPPRPHAGNDAAARAGEKPRIPLHAGSAPRAPGAVMGHRPTAGLLCARVGAYGASGVKQPFVNLEEKIDRFVGRRTKTPDSLEAGMQLQATASGISSRFQASLGGQGRLSLQNARGGGPMDDENAGSRRPEQDLECRPPLPPQCVLRIYPGRITFPT